MRKQNKENKNGKQIGVVSRHTVMLTKRYAVALRLIFFFQFFCNFTFLYNFIFISCVFFCVCLLSVFVFRLFVSFTAVVINFIESLSFIIELFEKRKRKKNGMKMEI